MKKVTIQASVATLTADEMRKNLSPETLEKLKGKKVHPWVVGETGKSRPRDLEAGGNLVLTWPRKAIQALRKAVKAGTKLFVNHGKGTNSHAGRDPVGEVVETFERELPDGTTQAIAVGLMDSDRPDLDVCSVEAQVDFDERDGEVIDVPEVSAVALGSSRTDSPAFAGAQRLAPMQFFGDDDDNDPPGDGGEPKGGANVATSFRDVQDYIREHGVAPSKLFAPEEIREDPRFSKLVEDNKAIVERAEKAEKERDDALAAAEEAKKAGEENAVKVAKTEGRKALEAALPEGTTDKQKKFLLDRFNPAGPDSLTEDALASYIEDGTKEFADLVKMVGGSDDPKGGKDSGDTATGDEMDDILEAFE